MSDGDAGPFEAVITEVDADGTLVLNVEFASSDDRLLTLATGRA